VPAVIPDLFPRDADSGTGLQRDLSLSRRSTVGDLLSSRKPWFMT
jgi:hypothetical protein